MSEYIVREYKKEDELKWLDLHATVMVDSYAWWTVLHKKPSYQNDIIDLIIEKEDDIIGFITTEINSDLIDMVDDDYGFVWEFGVHRDYRGFGLGKRLINETHQILKNKYQINQSIWFSQDKKAQKYYEKLGMEEIERHWQFSIKPDKRLKRDLKDKGFNCWNLRGECKIEDYQRVKNNLNIIEDNDTLKPRICIGYRYLID
ncbi:MAG: GNAT family N-acetyltransferase [Halanaerobiales bacterium]|nr:GNAT family N-acetyltransferase [Halanaerobiales bacterium]